MVVIQVRNGRNDLQYHSFKNVVFVFAFHWLIFVEHFIGEFLGTLATTKCLL